MSLSVNYELQKSDLSHMVTLKNESTHAASASGLLTPSPLMAWLMRPVKAPLWLLSSVDLGRLSALLPSLQ